MWGGLTLAEALEKFVDAGGAGGKLKAGMVVT
jgi:hypothetical protein